MGGGIFLKEFMEKIYIKGLQVRTIIGINNYEREEKQDILIDIVLWANLKSAMEFDDINKTVDYKALKKKILSKVENSSFYLIETLANYIAKLCFEDEKIIKAKVRVEKPGALRFAKTVGVEVILKRDE